MAVIQRFDHGPFLWTWSEDLGRTWTAPETTMSPLYGHSPALFMTKKGALVCGYRWVGDESRGFVGVAYSLYNREDGWNGVWDYSPTMIWLGGSLRAAVGGTHFAGYPTFAYADDERILCAYFMSWMGGGDQTTQDVEGVYLVETD